MRTTRLLAIAALAALPLGVTVASAAPPIPAAAPALSKSDAAAPVINVRRGGGHGMRGGGFGGPRFARGGGGPRFSGGFRGPRFAGGGPRRWHGGPGHWQGRPGHHHRHFRPRFYGVPYYYYGGYDPYFYDDYYDDDVVVYSQSGDAVARCEARYRSFDRRSGTFLSNDGTRKLCPYLR